jgi:hypothetical protein
MDEGRGWSGSGTAEREWVKGLAWAIKNFCVE